MVSATTSDQEVPGSNPARGGIQLMTVRSFIAQNLSLLSFHRLVEKDQTIIIIKCFETDDPATKRCNNVV